MSGGYVQFVPGPAGLIGEAVSDRYLAEGARLGATEESALEALGWRLEDGPNYSMHWPTPVDVAEVARIAEETLRAYGDDPAEATLESGAS